MVIKTKMANGLLKLLLGYFLLILILVLCRKQVYILVLNIRNTYSPHVMHMSLLHSSSLYRHT